MDTSEANKLLQTKETKAMYDTTHYAALMTRLSNEKARLDETVEKQARDLRNFWIKQIEKEIEQEVKFLKSKGIEVYASIDDLFMSDDELMNELLSDSVVIEQQEVAPQTITKEQAVIAARQWFADNAQACINEATSGQVKVNDLDKYVQDQKLSMAEYLNGTWDHTLAFQQRATFIQTGECHPILPK